MRETALMDFLTKESGTGEWLPSAEKVLATESLAAGRPGGRPPLAGPAPVVEVPASGFDPPAPTPAPASSPAPVRPPGFGPPRPRPAPLQAAPPAARGAGAARDLTDAELDALGDLTYAELAQVRGLDPEAVEKVAKLKLKRSRATGDSGSAGPAATTPGPPSGSTTPKPGPRRPAGSLPAPGGGPVAPAARAVGGRPVAPAAGRPVRPAIPGPVRPAIPGPVRPAKPVAAGPPRANPVTAAPVPAPTGQAPTGPAAPVPPPTGPAASVPASTGPVRTVPEPTAPAAAPDPVPEAPSPVSAEPRPEPPAKIASEPQPAAPAVADAAPAPAGLTTTTTTGAAPAGPLRVPFGMAPDQVLAGPEPLLAALGIGTRSESNPAETAGEVAPLPGPDPSADPVEPVTGTAGLQVAPPLLTGAGARPVAPEPAAPTAPAPGPVAARKPAAPAGGPEIPTWPPPGMAGATTSHLTSAVRGVGPLPARRRRNGVRPGFPLGALVSVIVVVAVVAAAAWYLALKPRHAPAPKAWDPRVASVAVFVQHAEGIPWKHPVQVQFLTPPEYSQKFGESLAAAQTQPAPSGANLAQFLPRDQVVYVNGAVLGSAAKVALAGQLAEALLRQYPNESSTAVVNAQAIRVQTAYQRFTASAVGRVR